MSMWPYEHAHRIAVEEGLIKVGEKETEFAWFWYRAEGEIIGRKRMNRVYAEYRRINRKAMKRAHECKPWLHLWWIPAAIAVAAIAICLCALWTA